MLVRDNSRAVSSSSSTPSASSLSNVSCSREQRGKGLQLATGTGAMVVEGEQRGVGSTRLPCFVHALPSIVSTWLSRDRKHACSKIWIRGNRYMYYVDDTSRVSLAYRARKSAKVDILSMPSFARARFAFTASFNPSMSNDL